MVDGFLAVGLNVSGSGSESETRLGHCCGQYWICIENQPYEP